MTDNDIRNASVYDLTVELYRRGHAVCLFQLSDYCDAVRECEELAHLTPAEMEKFAASVMDGSRGALEDRLSEVGNECLEVYISMDDGYPAAKEKSRSRGKEINAIVKSLEERGVESEALDDLVHDCAAAAGVAAANQEEEEEGQEAAICDAETEGSLINNDGLASQVAFLVMENGAEKAFELIEVAAQGWLAENRPKAG